MFKIIDYPLNFIRDYTIPPAQDGDWSRMRACVTPATMPLAFFTLSEMLSKEIKKRIHDPKTPLIYTIISCCAILPGAIIGIFIRYRTKLHDPPDWLRIVYSFLAFIMSIAWIKFTSDNIVDML